MLELVYIEDYTHIFGLEQNLGQEWCYLSWNQHDCQCKLKLPHSQLKGQFSFLDNHKEKKRNLAERG